MDQKSGLLFVSAISIAELESGIAKLRRTGATRRADALHQWLDTLLHLYANRVLPFEADTARLAGRLLDRARGRGHDPGFADAAIAATAEGHGLTILTRNLRHFAPLGIACLDPFEHLPR
jgi:toxin FitB